MKKILECRFKLELKIYRNTSHALTLKKWCNFFWIQIELFQHLSQLFLIKLKLNQQVKLYKGLE